MHIPAVHIRLWWVVVALVVAMVVLSIVGRKQYPWTSDDTWKSMLASGHEPYRYRLALALDLFANAIAGGRLGETISSRCGRWKLVVHGHGTVWHWLADWMCAWLDVIQPDHGEQAMSGDLKRAQNIVALETAALEQITSRPSG